MRSVIFRDPFAVVSVVLLALMLTLLVLLSRGLEHQIGLDPPAKFRVEAPGEAQHSRRIRDFSDTHGLVAIPEETKDPPPGPTRLIHANSDLCHQNPDLVYVIYVHSAPDHATRRHLLRTTWANSGLYRRPVVQLVFMLGRTRDDALNGQLDLEIEQHEDIVQGDFIEHYRNLTLKAVMALNWLHSYCSNAAFAIKVDDDTLVNIFQLLPYLEPHLPYSDHRVMICSRLDASLIRRAPAYNHSKWRISDDQFPGKKFYPRFCSGFFFVLSRGLISELVVLVPSTNYFWVDDVYVTGLLAKKVRNLRVIAMENTQRTLHADHFERVYADPEFRYKKQVTYLVTVVGSEKHFQRLWQLVVRTVRPESHHLLNQTLLAAVRTEHRNQMT